MKKVNIILDTLLTIKTVVVFSVLCGIIWFTSFPLIDEIDWADLIMESAWLIGFVIAFLYVLRSSIIFIKIGSLFFVFSLVIEVFDEFTAETISWYNQLTSSLALIGLIGITLGIKQLFKHGFKELRSFDKTSLALKVSERKYQTIFESLSDVYYQTDENMRIKIISPSVKEIGGYDPEELIGKKAHDFYFDSMERDMFVAALKEKGFVKDFEIRLVKKDGKVIVVSANVKALLGEDHQLIGLEGVLHDISERKKMEEALQEANTSLEQRVLNRTSELNAAKENFSNIFNNTSDALILLDVDNNVLDMNHGAEDIFGYTKDELLSNPDIRLEYYEESEQNTVDILRRLALDGQPQTAEWKGKKKDGTVFDEEVLLNQTDYNDRQALLLTVRDITERKSLEAKAKKRLEDLQTFEKLTVGRELRMVELKEKIKQLKNEVIDINRKT